MKPIRLAVVGFGRVGQACADVVRTSRDLSLAAIVRRAESVGCARPEAFRHIPVVSQISQAKDVRGALICVPTHAVVETTRHCFQQGIPIVESATLHGDALRAHRQNIHRLALRENVPAIVGAGWDPGALSIFRALFALLAPDGHTETTWRTGISLHHALTVRKMAGVRDALCTEQRTATGTRQRYVYVELEAGASVEEITRQIRADPLFLGEDTLVFPVESVAALEQEGHGVVLERRGAAGRLKHQQFLLEARFDESVLTAQVMVAATRALPKLTPGAHFLFEVPLGLVWGERQHEIEHAWL